MIGATIAILCILFYVKYFLLQEGVDIDDLEPLDRTFPKEAELITLASKVFSEEGIPPIFIGKGTSLECFYDISNNIIVLDRETIEDLSTEDIKIVLAHEIGHYKRRKTLNVIAISRSLLSIFVLIFFPIWLMAIEIYGTQEDALLATLAIIPLQLIVIFFGSTIPLIIVNFFLRREELFADAFSVKYFGEDLVKDFMDHFLQKLEHPVPLLSEHPSWVVRMQLPFKNHENRKSLPRSNPF